MITMNRETAILDRVRNTLVAEGYEVVLEPNSLLLPSFLEGFRPDALAYRKDKNLVVEVASQTPATEKSIKALQERVSNQPGWELRLVWTSAGTTARTLQRTPVAVILSTLADIERLANEGQVKAAFLLAWSCLEAVGRTLQPDKLARPQTPARLIEQLATTGAILPNEADELRELISKRNRLVHGELRVDVRKRDIAILVQIVRKLSEELRSAA